MKFGSSLIVVKDIEKSRKFYERLLDQEVVMDLGANVAFDGFALQTIESWSEFIKQDINDINLNKTNVSELYFEADDYDKFLEKLKLEKDVELLHDSIVCPWGQKVIRFYDPDNHIIEVGESLENLIKRLSNDGMSISQIIEKTGLPEEVILNIKNND